jgi:hypothetical protein
MANPVGLRNISGNVWGRGWWDPRCRKFSYLMVLRGPPGKQPIAEF